MIKDYEFELDTSNNFEVEKRTSKIVGVLKAILWRFSKTRANLEIQLIDHPKLIILNELSIPDNNGYIVPKIHIYNIGLKNHMDKQLEFLTLNDKLYLRLHGQKNLKGVVTLRVEE